VAPLILDVVDVHRPYQSQARERMTYYKKCGYKIKDYKEDSDSDKEDSMIKRIVKKTSYAFVDEE